MEGSRRRGAGEGGELWEGSAAAAAAGGGGNRRRQEQPARAQVGRRPRPLEGTDFLPPPRAPQDHLDPHTKYVCMLAPSQISFDGLFLVS